MSAGLITGTASFISTIPIALETVSKLLDKIPNYDDRKKNEFNKLRERYEEEKKSIYRDDNLVCYYYDQLVRFVDCIAENVS